MSENTVVLCEFDSADEAQSALERLRAQSIRGFVCGAAPHAVVRLHVDASQFRRAHAVLSALRWEEPRSSRQDDNEDDIDGWICQVCDRQVEEDATFCPACGETRPQRKHKHRRG